MTSNILANINISSAASSTGSWANITGLSVTSITVQGTDSVVLLMFNMVPTPATDSVAEYRFYINGSAATSPVLTAWSDNASNDEANSVTMVFAVDGLSGSSNSFSVQWTTVQGSPTADESRIRSFQIVEIVGGDAEILVNQSASDQVGDPSIWTDLFTAASISVVGTSSVLMMIANVPYEMEGDECTDFQFKVDTSRVGAVTSVQTDEVNGGDGWSGVHCLDGLSAGTHSFHLQWNDRTGAGQTRAVLRTFQVVEITASATLEIEAVSSAPGTAPGSWGNVDGLSDSYVVTATDAIQLIFANIQIASATDRTADFRIGVDGTEEGAQLISFTDSTNLATRILLARAKTGLSTVSHTFAARWIDNTSTPTLDEGRPRTLFVIELTQVAPTTYKLDGITKNNAGAALVSCECWLIKDNLDNTYTFIAFQVSHASTGAYSFTGLTDNDAQYQVLSVKDGTPVMDCTDHVLQPVEE